MWSLVPGFGLVLLHANNWTETVLGIESAASRCVSRQDDPRVVADICSAAACGRAFRVDVPMLIRVACLLDARRPR